MPEPTHHDPIARLLRDLPEDAPSMTWRAGLNEKLRAEGARRTRVRRWSFGSLGLGLVTASFAALMIVPAMLGGTSTIQRASVVVQRPVVAADDLLALDREGTTLAEISGAGIAAPESDLSEGEVQYVLASQML